jgi:hypothetical protein
MKQSLNEQFRRMQKIAGIITENQIKENMDSEETDSLENTGQDGVINDYLEKFNKFEQDNTTVEEYSNNLREFLEKYTDDDADRDNLIEAIKRYYEELINRIK